MDRCTDVVLNSYVRIARNIKDWKYLSRLTGAEVGKLNLEQGEAMEKLPEFSFRCLDEFSFSKRQLMVEKNYISPESLVSNGRYIATLEDRDPFVVFNEDDHIRIKCFAKGLDIFYAYNQCSEIERKLCEVFEYQNHPKYGYLTSSVDDSGTGLHIYATMFLPGLALDGKLDLFFKTADNSGILVKGYVDSSDSIPKGCIFLIENRMSIGNSAIEILTKLNDIYTRIISLERESRKHIAQTRMLDLEDKIMRSYGVIKYCKKLSIWDALELIADIKLGVCMDILDDVPDDIDTLFIKMQKYHVLAEASSGLEQDEDDVDCLRADCLRKSLGIEGGTID